MVFEVNGVSSEVGCVARFGFAACSTVLVAGVLMQGTAQAAQVSRPGVTRNAVVGKGDNDVDCNDSSVSGRANSVTANSPTKNKGLQNKSSNNSGREIIFQYGICKRGKNCKIRQR
ncbi:hypothetical protein GCM10009780_53850 [Actinomadura alba]